MAPRHYGPADAGSVAERAARAAAAAGRRLNTIAGIEQLARLGRGLVVDMDDTLISNQAHFDQATDALTGVFYRLDHADRSPQVLRDLHAEVDSSLVSMLGYTPERWFTAAEKTAEIIAGRDLTALEREEVRKAAEIAMDVGEILPGVEDALSACHKAGVRMLLKTKGCRDKQAEKLVAHRFNRFFGERIWIVDRKDPESFKQAVAHFGLQRPVSIGDSARSDIAPARKAGMDAILVNSGGQVPRHEKAELERGVMRAPSFPEAVQLLVDLEAVRHRQS